MENSEFRKTFNKSLDGDIFAANETFLRKGESVYIEGYTFLAHDRKNLA